MELNKKNMRKIMELITFTVLLLVGLMNFDVILDTIGWIFGILMPFIIGGCIAFIINVPMKQLEEKVFRKGKSDSKVLKKIRRPLSILLSLIGILGLILIVIFLISPELSSTLIKLFSETIPNFFTNVEKWFQDLTEKYPEIQKYISDYEFDWDKISTNIINITQVLAEGLFNSTFSIIGTIVSTIANFVIGLAFAIYLLSKKEKLSQQGKKLLYSYVSERRADRIITILKLTQTSFANFLSGQCVEAVIEGCLFFIVLSLFGFNYAMLIGVIAAFMALIPIFGAFIACVIGFFLLFMVNPIQALWFIVIFFIIQQVESNLIYPYVVGGSIGLPSIWVLFAVTVGGSLMGVAGMLVFIPLFSVCYILLRETVRVRLMVRRIPSDKYEKETQITLEQQRQELEERGRRRENRRLREQRDEHNASTQEEKQSDGADLSQNMKSTKETESSYTTKSTNAGDLSQNTKNVNGTESLQTNEKVIKAQSVSHSSKSEMKPTQNSKQPQKKESSTKNLERKQDASQKGASENKKQTYQKRKQTFEKITEEVHK